jgi:hypothetical protein
MSAQSSIIALAVFGGLVSLGCGRDGGTGGTGGTSGSGGVSGVGGAITTDGAIDTQVLVDGPMAMDVGESADAAGLDTAGLKSLTVNMSGGMGGCASSSYVLDFASKVLAWSFCGTDASPGSAGSQLLSDSEMREVNMILTNVLSTKIELGCGADKADEMLTLTYADHSAKYRDDFYSGCPRGPKDGIPYIKNLDTLLGLFWWIDKFRTVPTNFDTATFDIDPMSRDESDKMVAGCQSNTQSYKVTAATRELSWTLCRSPSPGAAFATIKGSRTLTAAEFSSIGAGLATLVLGASGDCTTVRAPMHLYLNGSYSSTQDYAQFGSDVGACPADWHDTPPFVIGLDAVVQTVGDLAGAL